MVSLADIGKQNNFLAYNFPELVNDLGSKFGAWRERR
jgi:hypothetical protein